MSSLLGLLAEVLGGDSVHVHDSLLGEGLAHGDGGTLLSGLVLGLTNEASKLELVEAVADVLASSHSEVLSLGSSSGLGTVVLAEALNTDLLAHVELVADRGSAGVKPVVVKRGEFLVAGGLNGLGPLLNIIKLESLIGRERKRPRQGSQRAHLSGLVTYVGDLEFVKFLQMLSEDLDELMRRYVLHSVYLSVE